MQRHLTAYNYLYNFIFILVNPDRANTRSSTVTYHTAFSSSFSRLLCHFNVDINHFFLLSTLSQQPDSRTCLVKKSGRAQIIMNSLLKYLPTTTSDFGAMSPAKLKCKVISTVNYYNYENINSFLVQNEKTHLICTLCYLLI